MRDGGPAFPCVVQCQGSKYEDHKPGMSVRQWLVGQAFASIRVDLNTEMDAQTLAALGRLCGEWAVVLADSAMLAMNPVDPKGAKSND